jgi:hypothetical protein
MIMCPDGCPNRGLAGGFDVEGLCLTFKPVLKAEAVWLTTHLLYGR